MHSCQMPVTPVGHLSGLTHRGRLSVSASSMRQVMTRCEMPVIPLASLTGEGHVDGELCAHTGHHLEPH